ncbi:MAG: MtnX-like HAD-IB family phosphatase [FCB group bacterium]|nr:MtnX-like HAD-IB family phosphatase [FCB group bacterium]
MRLSFDKLAIFSDFDGTITTEDTLVYLLDKYGTPDWWDIENRLLQGTIDEKQALPAEIDTLNVPWEEAINVLLEYIGIDPGFAEFLKWTENRKIPFTILSGGFKEIIGALLNHHFKNDFNILANSLEIDDCKWKVIPSELPKINDLCNNCKSFPLLEMKKKGYQTVYIGDGSTDRCPSSNADLVFAKSDLADYCRENSIEYHPYSNFSDILNIMCEIIDR